MPPVEKVRPGLWSIPVPLPNNSLRYVLVYLFETDRGPYLVDAGWNTDDAFGALSDGMEVAGCEHRPTSRAVMVTHIHPDHYGLAGRIREASGAWISLHPADAESCSTTATTSPTTCSTGWPRACAGWVRPPRNSSRLRNASMPVRAAGRPGVPDVLLEDGAGPTCRDGTCTAIWTPGHSPGHVCFYERRAPAHALGRPRPASHHPEHPVPPPAGANPLGDYLDSLDKLEPFAVEEVLPAHEYRFADLQGRLDELIAHHAERLDEIEQVVTEYPGSTAWEITLRLHWSRPWDEIQGFMQRQANGETVAHCILLELEDRLRRQGTEPARFFVAST